MSLQIKIDDSLFKALDKANLASGIRKSVKRNGAEMQRNAQRDAPVDTGALKRSINIQTEAGGFSVKVAPTMDYAAYVEWGTRYMTAQPYMRPNFHKQKTIFISDLNKLMK